MCAKKNCRVNLYIVSLDVLSIQYLPERSLQFLKQMVIILYNSSIERFDSRWCH